MPNADHKRITVLLVAVRLAGNLIALSLSSAAAGPNGAAYGMYLPVVVIQPTDIPTPTPWATSAPTLPTGTPTQNQQPANCAPSYPDECVPTPDLNCPNIPYRYFRRTSPDPHHFDAGPVKASKFHAPHEARYLGVASRPGRPHAWRPNVSHPLACAGI